jgi:soluble P-type ATPase
VIRVDVPCSPSLELRIALIDFNGTLACDGTLIDGVADRLRVLSRMISIHVATGNTTGTAPQALAGLPVELHLMPEQRQAHAKRALMQSLGDAHTAVIGNGRNDREIVAHAALSIVVVGREGCAMSTLAAADIVCTDIRDALDVLATPARIVATLRD